jgi:hypothetical protein
MQKLNLSLAIGLVALLLPFSSIASAQAADYLLDVTNVTVTPGEGSVQVAWDAVDGADSYTIYYGDNSVAVDGGTYANELITPNVTTYEVAGLTGGVEYFFAVAAEDTRGLKLGSANYSNEVSATPTAKAVVTEPAPITEETPAVVDNSVAEETTTVDESHAAAPEDLTQSGPTETAVTLAAFAGAAFLWLRRRTRSAELS